MSCPTGKAQHSFLQAKRLAKRASKTHERPMQPYRCPQCHEWHVGSQTHKLQVMRTIFSNHDWRLI